MRRFFSASVLGTLALGAAVSISVETAEAQYFGRNKVQYEAFDFSILQTPNFDIYFYPEEAEAVQDAARMAERWYARLSRILDHKFTERQPIIFYASHPHFQQTTALSGEISDATGGVTEAFKQRVIMPFGHSAAETDHVLGHELVHAFQYDISGLGRAGGGIEAAARRFNVPLWFVEGMAEYLSVGPSDPLTAIWLRNAAAAGEIPTIRQLAEDPRIFPYRYGHAVWAYVGGRWGDAVIGQILKLTGEGVPYQEAFQRILNVSIDDLSGDWHSAIRRAYLPQFADRREAREESRPLITNERGGGRLNLGPSLSPDGKYVAFLSERNAGDVDLLLADAETGQVIRRLQRGTGYDSHFNSLRYVSSAGSWSPDGKQFVMSALQGARDVLVLIDVEQGKRIRTMAVGDASEISSPAWSPDGRSIVVSGMAGGRTDLYHLDLETGIADKLTSDPYSALQPAFSPDGRTVAFVTDRFGTDWERLSFGEYRIALLELESREIRPVPGGGGSHSINPQWAPNGEELFFVSNRSGIPNIYRVQLATEEVHRITNLFSGVSGITELSPALTVARSGDRLLYTAFEQAAWNIYSLSGTREMAGVLHAEEDDAAASLAMGLPPLPRPTDGAFNRVASLLEDAEVGLPSREEAAAYATIPYRPRLGLDYLGQPQVGVSLGGGLFGGAGLYGGISGIFSDVLGRHTVGGVVQAQGQWDELGLSVQYLNASRRWNYGVGLHRIPTIYGYYSEGVSGGAFRQQVTRMRLFDTGLAAYALYPFSGVQRVEFSGGLRRIAQDQQVYDVRFNSRTGETQVGDRRNIGGVGFNMVEASAALVHDSGVFGYTAPVAGQRARFELSPTVGQLQYVTALADFRRYLHMEPFTLAVRALHYGRYGRDSEGVFSDLYLGNNALVRGYGSAYGQCVTTGQDCAVLNQLLGSRLGVANVELRVPLVKPRADSFLPPIDAHLFYDAGVAWTQGTRPAFSSGLLTDPAQRGILTSAGVGGRMNLFGAMIVEVDYVRAMALKGGWQWVIALQPGF